MKNSIYLPTFLSELSALVGKAFDPMRININTQQFSVEKQAPLSFAGDLGQLLLEWVFLLVDSGIGAVRFDFDIQPDKLGFSVVVSKDEWREKFREEPHFDILERKNPQIVNRIFFYLRKYNVNKKPEVMEIDQELRFTSLLNI